MENGVVCDYYDIFEEGDQLFDKYLELVR